MPNAALPLIADATLRFLRRYAPFSTMAPDALAFAVQRLSLAYFAKSATLLSPHTGPVGELHLVQRGLVGSRPADTEAPPDATLGPGEMFPVGALSAGDRANRTYHAIEDTFCFLLGREDFLELRRRSPEFERFCTHAITETLKQSLAQLAMHYGQRAAEQQTLTRPLGELVRRAPVTCNAKAPVRDALLAMDAAHVRTIVVTDSEGAPAGVFTLVDLLRRVALAGRPLDTPIGELMTAPTVTLPATATAYDAMHRMADRGIRQIVVVADGRTVGVVNERDLFALQRVSMRQVSEALDRARTIDELKHAADDIRGLARNLLAQGVSAEPLTRTIAALNDALTRRTIDIMLAGHDPGSVDWCWLALGSEGRGEQTFATDQDNALVFAANEEPAIVRERLTAFAHDVNEALAALGFALCTGDVMARHADYCLSVDEWQARFLDWIAAPTPQALLGANIVFDFRPLYGDATLAERLREWLFGYTVASPVFRRLLVQNALESTPPLGLIRAFATDDDPTHRGTIDLKVRGTRIFVDAARAFALAIGIADTGTAARLRQAGARLGVQSRHVEATVDAFHFLQLLRLRVQDQAPGHAAANRLDPDTLNEVDQRMLKEAFVQARKLQQRLSQTYLA